MAFALVQANDVDFHNSRKAQFDWLEEQGFEVVAHRLVNAQTIISEIENYANQIATFAYPSDGLVLTYEDIAYGESLGRTAKFPRDAIAFKWQDETKETRIKEVEWSAVGPG